MNESSFNNIFFSSSRNDSTTEDLRLRFAW